MTDKEIAKIEREKYGAKAQRKYKLKLRYGKDKAKCGLALERAREKVIILTELHAKLELAE